tara:strand:- start:337 stop:483 length:147 start_codon:yes stop_codon:yes gene_type:complete
MAEVTVPLVAEVLLQMVTVVAVALIHLPQLAQVVLLMETVMQVAQEPY